MLQAAAAVLSLSAAAAATDPTPALGSVKYDASSHTAVKSSGCGKSSPYSLGKTTATTGKYAGVTWTYRIYMPKKYSSSTPMPLVIHHPGWGMSASSEQSGSGICQDADSIGFVCVVAQGGDDNSNWGGPWYSWNVVGSTQSPGPAGYTCTSKANYPSYCYNSCNGCGGYSPQCDWTTCHETGPTPTGTGTKDIGGFIPGLYDTLESQLCIDTTREFASGESNGGMMTYQLGVDLADRLAAIVPEFGSFHRGFAMAPSTGVPVLDLHGSKDTTVPANVSLSGDGYYYTTTDEIFNGGKYSTGWKKSNGCSGASSHYPTPFDGQSSFWCVSEGTCSGGDVIRCSWNGGHNWLFNNAKSNGQLVTDFLFRWSKTTHLGYGYSSTKHAARGAPAKLLTNITILGEAELGQPITADRSKTVGEAFAELPTTLENFHWKKAHYGNPADGCRDDEEVVNAGTGQVCAYKVPLHTEVEALAAPSEEPAAPKCVVGGAAPSLNRCPRDAAVPSASKAWPVCVGHGANDEEDPYTQGLFHCLLVCPCTSVDGTNDCGADAHAHCPSGARCELGELRNRAQGVCTYH